MVIHTFIAARLDYCNSLLAGFPNRALYKFQLVQNVPTRILVKKGQFHPFCSNLCHGNWIDNTFISKLFFLCVQPESDLGQLPFHSLQAWICYHTPINLLPCLWLVVPAKVVGSSVGSLGMFCPEVCKSCAQTDTLHLQIALQTLAQSFTHPMPLCAALMMEMGCKGASWGIPLHRQIWLCSSSIPPLSWLPA